MFIVSLLSKSMNLLLYEIQMIF